jgi:hypothetical protein
MIENKLTHLHINNINNGKKQTSNYWSPINIHLYVQQLIYEQKTRRRVQSSYINIILIDSDGQSKRINTDDITLSNRFCH